MKNKLKQLMHRFYYRINPTYRAMMKLQKQLQDFPKHSWSLQNANSKGSSTINSRNLGDFQQFYSRIAKNNHVSIIRYLDSFNVKLNKINSNIIQMMKVMPIDSVRLNSGERQVGNNLSDIREDHVTRYNFASKFLPSNIKILDIACGVGYGSYIMSKAAQASKIQGIDISSEAIDYANQHYKLNNNNFKCGDFLEINLEKSYYDAIVSFETIEHVRKDKEFLKKFFNILKPEGKLILSTPNEELLPFKQEVFLHHVRHYTPKELEEILNSCGFEIEKVFSQKSNKNTDLIEGWSGIFNIVVCSKISNNNIA